MYTKGKITYSDAGYILRDGVNLGYSLENTSESLTELEIDLEEMEIRGITAVCPSSGASWCIQGTYSELKSRIIHERYSDEEELAILLNREESEEKEAEYQKLQAWRLYARNVARKILDLCGED